MPEARSTDPAGGDRAAMHRLLALLPAPTRAQMVAMYLDGLQAQLAEIAGLLAAGDPAARALVHKLAGSAAMMQDAALSGPARALEHALQAGDEETAAALWPKVQAQAALTRQALAGAD